MIVFNNIDGINYVALYKISFKANVWLYGHYSIRCYTQES